MRVWVSPRASPPQFNERKKLRAYQESVESHPDYWEIELHIEFPESDWQGTRK
jgi:hypothetical protein